MFKKILIAAVSCLLVLTLCSCPSGNDVIESGKQFIENGIEEATGLITITYDANGGDNAPSSQYVNVRTEETLKISKKIPTRYGYHFKGWQTADGKGYHAGSTYESDDVNYLKKSTTLYAIWSNDATSHHYTVNANKGEKTVTVVCECGKELKPDEVTFEQFVDCKYGKDFQLLDETKQKRATYQYAIFKGQSEEAVRLMDTVNSKLSGKLKSDNVLAADLYTQFLNDKEIPADTITEIDKTWDGVIDAVKKSGKIVKSEEFISELKNDNDAEEFLESLSDKTEALGEVVDQIGNVLTVAKAVSYLDGLKDEKDPEKAVLGFVDTVKSFTDMLGPVENTVYGKLLDSLSGALKLFFNNYLKHKYSLDFHATMAGTPFNRTGDKQYRFSCMPDMNRWKDGPSLQETVKLYAELKNDDQKELISQYISYRLNYEFNEMTGITLEEYLECFQETGSLQKVVNFFVSIFSGEAFKGDPIWD